MKTNLRKAVAMIELIFSIVVMGIVMMSAPMLISTASKSGYVGMQQEAINEATSQLNMILGYHWDENDTDEDFADALLVVSNLGDDELDQNDTTSRRQGTPKESSRSYTREDGETNLTASTIASFGEGVDNGGTETENDDMDDFDGTTITLNTIENSEVDYIDKVSIKTDVSYIADDADYATTNLHFTPDYVNLPADTTNIKHIQVTLKSISNVEELKKTIIFHAFSCNIGAYKLESKDF